VRKLLTTLAVAAATVGLTATTVAAGPPATRPGPPSAGPTIVDVAVGASNGGVGVFDENPNDFDILVNAVVALDLAPALSSNRQLTVFAPTDGAFIALADALTDGPTPTEAEAFEIVAGVPGLLDIVLFHVTPGLRDANSVVPASSLPTLSGTNLTKAPGTATLDSAIGTASIGGTVYASNGIIHVIDTVLLPGA
jgi:uncharacterized surface protein with fasciclin (FAS1) repeats